MVPLRFLWNFMQKLQRFWFHYRDAVGTCTMCLLDIKKINHADWFSVEFSYYLKIKKKWQKKYKNDMFLCHSCFKNTNIHSKSLGNIFILSLFLYFFNKVRFPSLIYLSILFWNINKRHKKKIYGAGSIEHSYSKIAHF
jgi:hypothetical protein